MGNGLQKFVHVLRADGGRLTPELALALRGLFGGSGSLADVVFATDGRAALDNNAVFFQAANHVFEGAQEVIDLNRGTRRAN